MMRTVTPTALFLLTLLWATTTDAGWDADWQVTDPRFRLPHEHGAVDPPQAGLRARETSPPLPPELLRRGRYQSVQVNLDAQGQNVLWDAANEPSLAIDPNDPDRLVIGWRQFDTVDSNFRQAGVAYSHDGGQTWTAPGTLDAGTFRSDPVLAADDNGRFYYYSLTGDPFRCWTFLSDDGGVTWTGPIDAYGGDKAWTAVDRTGGMGDGNFYAAWDYAGCCEDRWFTRSVDGGLTYMNPIVIPGFPFWGTVTIDADGRVYVAGRTNAASVFTLARSDDAWNPAVTPSFALSTTFDLGGALLFAIGYGPNPGGLLGQVWIDVDRSGGPYHGHVYAAATVDPPGGADPCDFMFVRSSDRGATWSAPVRINDDAPGNWQWFGTMSVAPDGRIDAIWNDTRNSGEQYSSSEVFYSYSEDGGQTWTPGVPITPPFNSWVGWPNQNKLGDYYHMISDALGARLAYSATHQGAEQDVYFVRINTFDCNNNGVHDDDDIAGGTSADCNSNGVPDECDVFEGTSTDVNGNQVPDECEPALADLNCDGLRNAGDIDAFVLALIDPAGYATTYPACDIGRADVNADGLINAGDIDPFVLLIAGP